jgi:ABC-type Na+ efflux pump permease subunit
VAEERESRVVEILPSSVSAKRLLTGKVLGFGVAGLPQIDIWLLSVVVAAKIFRVGILIYGKRPSLREIAPYLRES